MRNYERLHESKVTADIGNKYARLLRHLRREARETGGQLRVAIAVQLLNSHISASRSKECISAFQIFLKRS